MVIERKKNCIKISEVNTGDTFCFVNSNVYFKYGVCMKCVNEATGCEHIVSIQTGRIVSNKCYDKESAVSLINGKFVEV